MAVRDVPEALRAAVGTAIAYLVLLGIMFLALFVVPYAVFRVP